MVLQPGNEWYNLGLGSEDPHAITCDNTGFSSLATESEGDPGLLLGGPSEREPPDQDRKSLGTNQRTAAACYASAVKNGRLRHEPALAMTMQLQNQFQLCL